MSLRRSLELLFNPDLSLNAPPRFEALAVDRAPLQAVVAEPDFPRARFVRDLLASMQKHRAEQHPATIPLSLLVEALREHAHLAEDAVQQLLDSEDAWMRRLGARLLDAFPSPQVEPILEEMDRHGVSFAPYQPGLTLGRLLGQQPALFERLYLLYPCRSDNFRQAVLWTLRYMPTDPPLPAQRLILDALPNPMAVVAAGRCQALSEEAAALLRSLLSDSDWAARGNAAMSLAMIGDDAPETLRRVADLLQDRTGNDWSVDTACLEALAVYGPRARGVLTQVWQAYNPDDRDDSGWPSRKALLAGALEAIGEPAPEVLRTLENIVQGHENPSSRRALQALGSFGPAALPVVDTIRTCIRANPADAWYDAETARSCLAALTAIAGPEHPATREVLQRFREDGDPDVRALGAVS